MEGRTAPAKSSFSAGELQGSQGGSHLHPKIRLTLLAIPIAFYLSSQSFSIFIASFLQSESVDAQMFVYSVSVVLILLRVAFFAAGIVVRRSVERIVLASSWPAWIACGCGLVGLVLLQISGTLYSDISSGAIFALLGMSLPLLAFSSVTFLFSLALRIMLLELRDAGFLIGAAGCFWALLSVMQAFVEDSGSVVFALSCIVIAIVVPRYPKADAESGALKSRAGLTGPVVGRESSEQCGEGSKGLMVLFFAGVILCLVSAVFPRLFTTPVFGAITTSERAFIAYVCFLSSAIFTVLLGVLTTTRKTISLAFAFCSMMLILSFFLSISFFSAGAGEFGTGAIKANETIFKIYLLILVVFVSKTSDRVGKVTAICFYGIFVLALPDLVINGIVKPLNFAYSFHVMESVRIPATAIVATGAVAITFVTILFDLNNSRKSVVVDVESYERMLCESAAMGKGLTPRESEVLLYLHRGFSVKKMAELMCVSTSTVQTHIASLYRKLDVHSKQELIDLVNETIV